MASPAEVQVARQRAGAPIVKLTATPTAGDAPLSVVFSTDGTGTGAPLISWALDFGDGTEPVTGRAPLPRTVDHLYATAGDFTAALTIRDEQAATGYGEVRVTVTAPPPPGSDGVPLAGPLGGDESHKAALAAAAIVAAFSRFLSNRRPEQARQVDEIVTEEAPALPADRRQAVIDTEADAERAYAAKARARLDRDVPNALRIADPAERERELDRILARERRYLEQRERAMRERATGRAAAAMVRVLSPTGAFWKLNPQLDNCRWCRAMAGRAWNWAVLSVHVPPVHPNCACHLVPLDDAIRRGWLRPGASPLGMESLPSLALLEAPADHDHDVDDWDDEDDDPLEDLLDLVEAAYERRWGKGTENAGRFRPQRGGDPGARLRRRRGLRMPRMHDPEPAPSREPRAVKRLDRELDVRPVPIGDIRPGDEVMSNGELDRVVKVDEKMPGLLTLERGGLVYIDRPTVSAITQGRPPEPAPAPPRPDLPEPADGDRYVLRLRDRDIEVYDRQEQESWGSMRDEDAEEGIALVRDLNTQHRADIAADEPAPPQTGGGPTLDDVLKATRARRPKEAGPIAPGVEFDPELSRSTTGPDGALRVPPGFFKQTRAVREKVVLRHLGGRLAEGLDADALAGLREQEPTLSSKRAIVDAYFGINADEQREHFVALRPDAARLVAAAAHERGLPLHPDAAKLARRPAAADAPEPEHPAQDLARRLQGMDDGEAHSALTAAGYAFSGTLPGGERFAYRNHGQGAEIVLTGEVSGRHTTITATEVKVANPLPAEVRSSLVGTGNAKDVSDRLKADGFSLQQRGEWVEAVHADGRGYALKPNGASIADAAAFTPTDAEIRGARRSHLERDPLAAIKVGDDHDEIRAIIDHPAGRYRMEASGGNGETVGGAKIDLPDGTTGFATYGRGPDALTIQYTDRDGVRRVSAVGLADPDPAHPGRIVTPTEHAATSARIEAERAAAEAEARAKAAKAAAGLSDAIRTGDADAVRAALGPRTINQAAEYLRKEGLDLRGRRRSRDKDTREPLVTYTFRGPGGETVKITGPLRFSGGTVTKIDVQANPQGGRRDRLPQGQAPKDLDELLVDTLGRADELGERFDAGVFVSAVVQGNVPGGAAAVHEWNGAIGIGKGTQAKRLRAYLAKRKKGEALTDRDHLTFYDDVETLQHEVNHGVAKRGDQPGGLSFGPKHYGKTLGVNVEEALTEETAHLLTAEWLRSWGMTDVLAAVKRNPEDPRTKGVYRDFRVQMKHLLDRANVPESERPELLMRWKFRSTPEERNAEIVQLVGARDMAHALFYGGLDGREGSDYARERSAAGRDFQPVLRPDLSDIDGEPAVETPDGQRVTIGAEVTAKNLDGRMVPGVVIAVRSSDGVWAAGVKVRFEDGTELWIPVGHVGRIE